MPKTKRAIRLERFLSHIELPQTGKLLDLSCGEGRLLGFIKDRRPELILSGIDFMEQSITTAKLEHPGIDFQVAPASALPFPNDFFDVTTCTMSFHHYADPVAIIKEISRTLKTQGSLYLMDIVPKNKLSQWLYNLKGCGDKYHFERFYLESELVDLLASAGLSLVNRYHIKTWMRVMAFEFKKQ